MLIGFLMSVLAINYVEYSMVLPNVVFWQPAAPIVAAAVMAVPLYDTLRIFIIRASRGKSPFKADKDHIHHHMLELGLSQGQVVISLLALNLLILSIIIISSTYLSNTGLLVVLLGSSMLLFPTNRFKRKLVGRFVSEEWDNLVNENGKVAEDKNEKTIEIIEEDQKEYSSSTEEINKGKMKEKLEKV